MPALVKSRVGSWAGTSGEDRTTVCPRRRKYSRNRARISLPVIGAVLSAAGFLDAGEVGAPLGKKHPYCVASGRGGVAAAQEILGEAGGRARGLAAQESGQPAPAGLERARGFAHLLERGGDRGLGHGAGNPLGEQLLAQPMAADPASTGAGLSPPAGEGLIVHVAAFGEVGDDGQSDLGGGGPGTEGAGQLPAPPGLSGQKNESRQPGGPLLPDPGGGGRRPPPLFPQGGGARPAPPGAPPP